MLVLCDMYAPKTLEVFTLHGDKDTPQASGTFLRDGKALHLEVQISDFSLRITGKNSRLGRYPDPPIIMGFSVENGCINLRGP